MVSFSGVLGKLSPLQYLIMAFLEIMIISSNEFVGTEEFGAVDFVRSFSLLR
jgi:hypothetical protein